MGRGGRRRRGDLRGAVLCWPADHRQHSHRDGAELPAEGRDPDPGDRHRPPHCAVGILARSSRASFLGSIGRRRSRIRRARCRRRIAAWGHRESLHWRRCSGAPRVRGLERAPSANKRAHPNRGSARVARSLPYDHSISRSARNGSRAQRLRASERTPLIYVAAGMRCARLRF